MCFDSLEAQIAHYIEIHGYRRDIAGESDFTAAVKAIASMHKTGLGLIIGGEYGCGKTLLAGIVAKVYHTTYKVRLGVPEETDLLTESYMEYFANYPYEQNVFLDDLGAESAITDFGVRRELCGEFICGWHQKRHPGTRLFVTTNLRPQEIDERYGGRVLSRLKDLCTPLALKGDDKRKWTI